MTSVWTMGNLRECALRPRVAEDVLPADCNAGEDRIKGGTSTRRRMQVIAAWPNRQADLGRREGLPTC